MKNSRKCAPSEQRLTFRFRNFSVSKLLPNLWGFRFRKIWFRFRFRFPFPKEMSIFECFRWVLASEQRYLAEIILTQLTIKVPNFGPKNSNFACKSQIFRISFQKMLRSLGLGLGLETFAKFLRVSVSVSKNLVSEKSLGFGFGKIWSRKKVSVSVSENLVSEEKYRFRKNLVSEKFFGFGKFCIVKKVSVSVIQC